jgi:hypothetical protein
MVGGTTLIVARAARAGRGEAGAVAMSNGIVLIKSCERLSL